MSKLVLSISYDTGNTTFWLAFALILVLDFEFEWKQKGISKYKTRFLFNIISTELKLDDFIFGNVNS